MVRARFGGLKVKRSNSQTESVILCDHRAVVKHLFSCKLNTTLNSFLFIYDQSVWCDRYSMTKLNAAFSKTLQKMELMQRFTFSFMNENCSSVSVHVEALKLCITTTTRQHIHQNFKTPK